MLSILEVAKKINELAKGHRIGGLQNIRKKNLSLDRKPINAIFSSKSIQDSFAFHSGGRTELQFNIGFDLKGRFRHGVAFSLELSQSLPDITPLIEKISRFNQYIKFNKGRFADLSMWHYDAEKRSGNYEVGEILNENIKVGNFIFIGRLALSNEPDYQQILADFDRLLDVYEYVESNESHLLSTKVKLFNFTAGCSIKPSLTTKSQSTAMLGVILRHNDIQYYLYKYLANEYGSENVGTEITGVAGTRLDLVVRFAEQHYLYEIKTSRTARGCVREALAQLLEYSYWPGATEAQKLIVIGEAKMDEECRNYLSFLRGKFSLPLSYMQFDLKNNVLIE